MFNPWALLTLIIAFVLNGFYWNAHGSNAEHARMVAKLESERAQALQKARDTETQWQEEVNEVTTNQAGKLAEVQRHLDVAIVSLRDRPSRPAGLSAAPRTDCAGANGAELARSHAEFLERYAAAAAIQDAGLEACYAAYDGTMK